jgi:hypothetical protein
MIKEKLEFFDTVFNTALSEISDEIRTSISNDRLEEQGYTKQQAINIKNNMDGKKIGEIFSANNTLYCKTPYQTVVSAQIYMYTIQQSLITCGTHINTLEQELANYKKYTFYSLIKLIFKKLINKG